MWLALLAAATLLGASPAAQGQESGSARKPVVLQTLSARWSAALASWSNARLLEAYERSTECSHTPETPARGILVEELRLRARQMALSDDDWRLALRLADVIHCRPTWPADEPLVVWLRTVPWLHPGRIRVRAVEPALGTIAVDDFGPSWCAQGVMAQLDYERALELHPLPRGTPAVLCEVTIEAEDPWFYDVPAPRHVWRRPRPRCLWSGSHTLAVAAVDDASAAMEPATSSEIDGAIRESLRLRSYRIPRCAEPAIELFRRAATRPITADMQGMAVSACVELHRFGRMIAGTRRAHLFSPIPLDDFPLELLDPAADLDGWTVLMRGSYTGALSEWEDDRWWSGELDIPLAELVARGVRD